MRITTLALFLCVSLFTVQGQQGSLSLEQAIVTGLKNNYQIQISKLEASIARNNNSWGQAGAYPTISLNAQSINNSKEYVKGSEPGPAPGEVSEAQVLTAGVGIDLNWVVFNGFKIRTTKAQLANMQEQSEGNAAILVENTLQSIILAYQLALLQQETLHVLKEVMALSADRYAYVLAKKNFGSAVTFDVLQAENNYLADSANVLRQQINFQNSIRNLNLILSLSIDTSYTLSSGFLQVDQDFALADLLAKLESSNKTLKNQYIYQEILKKNVQLGQSKLYPMISLSAGAGKDWTGNYRDYSQGTWSDQYGYNVNLVLSWTLSNGGNVRRAIKNARIEEEIGSLQTEQMKLSLYNQLFSVLADYTIKKQLKSVAEKGVQSARLNLEIAEDKYKNGSINSFNYRDIQLVYQNASSDLLQANYNLIESYTELLRLTGGIITELSN
jgi:outer membrane protein